MRVSFQLTRFLLFPLTLHPPTPQAIHERRFTNVLPTDLRLRPLVPVMADPLSVAGLTAGMVSLGLQVCGGITSYLDALKCGEQDIASTRQQTDRLDKALQAVEASLLQPQQKHQAPTAAVHGCLDSCSQEFKALQTLMDQLAGPDQTPSGGRKYPSFGQKVALSVQPAGDRAAGNEAAQHQCDASIGFTGPRNVRRFRPFSAPCSD